MKQSTALGILKSGRNVFLTGSAGTGKTFLINQYTSYLKERKIKPAIVAPTGIAASHIGGVTIHSFFSIGIREYIDEYYLDKLMQMKSVHERLSKLKVLIIDEVSMVSPGVFESMDKILRAIKFTNKPFGGVQIILSGDFFQLPPVSKEWKEIRFIWQTELWNKLDLKVAYLEEKFRQDEDDMLVSILDEIRSGDVSQQTWEILEKKMTEKTQLKFNPTKLYTHNMDVDRINLKELDKLTETSNFFEAIEKGSRQNLEKIYKSSLVQEKLELKKGAVVIFIKNNYEKGYINGTLGVILDFEEGTKYPIVEIASGRKIIAERDDWSRETDTGKVQATVKQIPLRLAWAITVHKSQGMTLDAAEIDLSKTFEPGQGYVALSRIKSIDGLSLSGMNNVALMVDEQVLSVDRKFKAHSIAVEEKFLEFSDEKKQEMFDTFITIKGGTLDKKEIAEEKVFIEKEEKQKNEAIGSALKKIPSISTFQLTKELIEKEKNISELMKERGLTKATIMNHLEKLVETKSLEKSALEYLKPGIDLIDTVQEVVDEINADKKEENFSEDGKMRLTPIFKMLDGEVEFEEIRLALIFID